MPKVTPELRRLRYEHDLSTAQVADRVLVTEGTVRNIEAGRKTASWRLLHRFARLYGVPVERFLREEGTAVRRSRSAPSGPDPSGPPEPQSFRQPGCVPESAVSS